MRVVLIIPARYESSRFPGKALAPIKTANGNKSLIQWVYERAQSVGGIDSVCVATDDERIQAVVDRFGGKVSMTRPDHQSGTDRVFEAATTVLGGEPTENDVIVNLQGDEPLVDTNGVVAAIELVKTRQFDIATLACPLDDHDLDNPNVVKLWMEADGKVKAFSRLPALDAGAALQHVGIYVFRGDVLKKFCSTAPTPSEKKERLEQLRAMELGFSIGACKVKSPSVGVDVPADVERLVELMDS